MVLPAPAPHDAHGPDADAWLVRLSGILQLVESGVLVLVDGARPARLGDLVRGLLPAHPDLEVITSAPALAQAEKGALLILVPQPDHADWLNQERSVLANRALRVILFSDEQTTTHLARRAPDFFHWISHRVECPDGVPRFAVNGLRAALRARARGVAWGGGDLEGCFAVALPGRELIRASASLGYEQMVEVARPRGRGWVAWTDVDSEIRLRRVRWASAETGRRARSILVEPAVEAPGFVPVHGRMMGIPEARGVLAAAGAKHPGRLAALLDLEPEAVITAAWLLFAREREETAIAAEAAATVQASWLRRRRLAADVADEVEVLLHEERAGKARWDAVAKVAEAAGDPGVSEVWALRARGHDLVGLESMLGVERPRRGALPAKPGNLLPEETIRELHRAAISAELGYSRTALFSGVDEAFSASLAMSAGPATQLLSDLHALNRAGVLADGSVPLATWLKNAAVLAGLRREAPVFRRGLDQIGDWTGASAAGSPRRLPRAMAVSVARLPSPSKELFGRETELQWLDACWHERVHVASIVAFGGVGKTALVNRWLTSMRDKGWDGAARVYGWSFYGQGTDRLASSDEFIDAALRWFGDPDPTQGSAWDRGERLATLVRRDKTILILDGIEPLQWAPGEHEGKLKDPALQALVRELGAQNTGTCLITSRLAVDDLEGGDKVRVRDLAELSPEAGAALLRARGVKGTDAELQEASREYDGHALALTLLGSYLEDVAEGDVRRRREIGPLEEDERHGGHARRVMAAYERWLAKPEVAILRMVGLFDRPAEEDEIAALREEPAVPGLTDALANVGGRAWNQAIAKLRRAGLLSAEQDKMLDAHPLVRDHFGEQLRREQPKAWREGHRRLYEHLRRKAKPLPETIAEMEPLYEAVVHGCLAGKNQEALDDVWRKRIDREKEIFGVHKLGANAHEVATLSAFFDPPWDRLAPGLSKSDQAAVPHRAALGLRALGRLAEAATLMRMALAGYIANEDWVGAAIAAANVSELDQARGRLDDALKDAREGVEHADRSGVTSRRSINKTTRATVLHAMGHWKDAAASFREAEEERCLDRLWGFRYCDLLLDQSRYDDARERAARSLSSNKGRYPLLDEALDHLTLGRAYLLAAQQGSVGDVVPAASHLAETVDGLRRAGRQDYLPLGLLARAALHTHTRDFPDARRDLYEALAIATRSGFRLHEADAQLGFANLALAEADAVAAREHLAKARAIIEQTGYHRRDAELSALEAEAAATSSGTHAEPSTG